MISLKGSKFSISKEGMLQFQRKYLADTEDDALFSIPATYRGLPRQGHNGGEWDAGIDKWLVDATYQGLVDDPGKEFDQYEINPETREEAIESHPYRDILEEVYGGYEEDGRLKFPTVWVTGSGGGTGLEGGDGGIETHPFFNVTSYPVDFDVARVTYLRKSVPASAQKRRGTVVTELPAGFEYRGDATHWYRTRPQRTKHGNMWRITDIYKELTDMKHFRLLMGLMQSG